MDKVILDDYTALLGNSTPEYLKALLEEYNFTFGWVRPASGEQPFKVFASATMELETLPGYPEMLYAKADSGPYFSCFGTFKEHWEVSKFYTELVHSMLDIANKNSTAQIADIDLVTYQFNDN